MFHYIHLWLSLYKILVYTQLINRLTIIDQIEQSLSNMILYQKGLGKK